jgi:hypothetical protein
VELDRAAAFTQLGMGVDLEFTSALPPESIDSLTLGHVVSDSTRYLSHLSPGLRKLYLGNAGLTDDVLQHVARLTRLKYIQTFGNSFTDAGVQQLAVLQNIEYLYLEEESLSASALGSVHRLPHLVQLGLQDVRISDDELVALQQALPGVRVSR